MRHSDISAASVRRTSSSRVLPSTPTVEIAHLSLATPPVTPPRDLLPAYARARALLRPTANNTSSEFAGRESERQTIQDFVSNFIAGEVAAGGASLYVSGSPGCGKTALVNSVLASISEEDSYVRVVSLNCMALNGIDALWERLAEALGTSKTKTRGKAKGRAAVEHVLKHMTTKWLVPHIYSWLVSSSSFQLVNPRRTRSHYLFIAGAGIPFLPGVFCPGHLTRHRHC